MSIEIGFFALGYAESIFHNPINKAWALRLPIAAALVIGLIALVVVERLRGRWLPLVTAPRTQTVARAALVVAVLGYAAYAYLVRPGILTGRRGGSLAALAAILVRRHRLETPRTSCGSAGTGRHSAFCSSPGAPC